MASDQQEDYYQVLGVSRDASDDEIRKAYRRMARKYHPDIAGEQYKEKFEQVNRAYSVLSDPKKKQMYDAGVDPDHPQQPGFGAADFGGFSDIFSDLFTGGFGSASQRGPIPRQQPGQDALTHLTISLKDAVFGAEKNVEVSTYGVCPTCKGAGSADGSAPTQCPVCHGSGYQQKVSTTLLGQMVSTQPCENCQGHGTVFTNPCPTCHGEGRVRTNRSVGVRIPAGIHDKTRIRLASQGAVGEGAGPAGDLYVDITVAEDKNFTRSDDDLHCWLRVPMTWAALGHAADIDTFDGPRKIQIPEGSQEGDTVSLDGLGVAHLDTSGNSAPQSGARGNLIVHLQVSTPANLNRHQKELLTAFADSYADQGALKQQAKPIERRKGFFSKLKNMFA